MKKFLQTALFILSLLSFPVALYADVPANDLKGHDFAHAPSVMKAEKYLRDLKTARARFLQTAQDGSQLIGTFYLSRPGKLRFEYDDPVKDFIVADGFFIYFYDAQLGEQSNAPIGQTLADFLLRKDLQFGDAVTVDKVQRGGGLLQVTLVQSADPAAGSLTLGFEENPMQLKKWRVVDAQGMVTEVELFQMQTGMKFPPGLFVYMDPDRLERPYNE